jgi:hypothetical protein
MEVVQTHTHTCSKVALRVYKIRKVTGPHAQLACTTGANPLKCNGAWKFYPATYGGTSAAALLFNWESYKLGEKPRAWKPQA